MKKQRHVSPGKLIVIVLWIILILVCLIHRDQLTIEGIVSFTPDAPTLAAAVMLGLFTLKGATVLMNGNILYAASGVMFSLPAAILVNTTGTLVMTTIPFLIGRKGGEQAMETLVQKYPKLAALRNTPQRSAFCCTFVLRVLGILPCEPVGMYLGACRIPYFKYICGTVLGLLPAITAYALIGEYAAQPRSPQFILAVMFLAATTCCSIAAAALWNHRSRRTQKKPTDTAP